MLQKLENQSKNHFPNLLTEFFDGLASGEGMIIDRFGKVRQKISVEMEGSWEGQTFRLDEQFRYHDGNSEQRNWSVLFQDPNHFTAACPELKKPAVGHCDDQEVRMNYTYPVPINGRTISLDFDDRMYRISHDTMLERAVMKKFGITFAEIILAFRKV